MTNQFTRDELHLIASAMGNRAAAKVYASPALADDRAELQRIAAKAAVLACLPVEDTPQGVEAERESPWHPGKRRTPYDHAWGEAVDGVARCECGARSDSDNYPVCKKSSEYQRIFALGQQSMSATPEASRRPK